MAVAKATLVCLFTLRSRQLGVIYERACRTGKLTSGSFRLELSLLFGSLIVFSSQPVWCDVIRLLAK